MRLSNDDIQLNAINFYCSVAQDNDAWDALSNEVRHALTNEMKKANAINGYEAMLDVARNHIEAEKAKKEAQNAEVNVPQQGQEESNAQEEV